MIKHKQPTFHFLITSVIEWAAGDDLNAMMTWANKRKNTYWVWYVPCHKSKHYDINFYQPQVKGCFVLAQVEFDQRGRIVKKKEEQAA
jgi:hypothetical protein